MKFIVKLLAFIPLSIELLMLLVIFSNKIAKIGWGTHIPIIILLAFIGSYIGSENKNIQKGVNVALIILTILFCIIGYYDYVQWFTLIIGVIVFIYFIAIRRVIKKLK